MPSEGGFESSLPAPCWMIAVMLLWFGSVEIGFCMARTKWEKMGEQRGNVFETLKSDERKRKKAPSYNQLAPDEMPNNNILCQFFFFLGAENNK